MAGAGALRAKGDDTGDEARPSAVFGFGVAAGLIVGVPQTSLSGLRG